MTPSSPAPGRTPDEGPSARGAVRNSLAILTGQAFGTILRTAGTLLLLALLGREDYGVLTAAVVFVDPIRSLAVLGIDAVAIRAAAAAPRSLPRVIGSLLRVRMVLGLAAFVVASIAGFALRSDAPGGAAAVVCAALVILPSSVYGPVEAAFQARQRMKRLITVPAAANGVGLIAVLALWAAGAPLLAFIAIPALTDTVSAFLASRRLSAELADAAGSTDSDASTAPVYDAGLARSMLRQGLPLAYVNVVAILYGRVGFYFLESAHGVGSVADLGAASKLVSPILLVGAALSVSLAPYATRLATEGRHAEFRRFFGRLIGRVLLVVLPLAGVGSLAIGPFVAAFKPEYAAAVPAFRWLAFGAAWMLICHISSACLIGMGRFRTIAAFCTLNLIVFVGLAWPLSKTMAAEGVAVATFAMEALNAVLQVGCVFWLLRHTGKRDAN